MLVVLLQQVEVLPAPPAANDWNFEASDVAVNPSVENVAFLFPQQKKVTSSS